MRNSCLVTPNPPKLPPPAPSGVVPNGLVAEYRFDEGAGQTLRDYGIKKNNLHGQLGSTAGADTNDPTWTAQGLSFITDDYVSIANDAKINDLPAGISIIIAVKHNALGSEEYLISKNGFNQYKITKSIGNNFVFTFKTNTGVYDVISSSAVLVDTPVLFAATYQTNGLVRTYHNGVPDTTVAKTGAILSSASVLTLGKRSDISSGYLNGVLYYVLLYNRALSPTEIKQNYHVLRKILAGRGITV